QSSRRDWRPRSTAEQHMRPIPRLAEKVARASSDHLLAESDERGDDLAQGQLLRSATIQRQHVDAEARLQRGVAVELVEDNIGLGVALQFDDDAQALAVALVAQIGDTLDQFLADSLGDALDQLRLVDLVGQ